MTSPRRDSGVKRMTACLLAASAGAASLSLGGCNSPAAQRAADSNSVLAVFSPPGPADAARWSQDPFDPDKRLRGTNLLANAPFGGEDVYVRMYTMKLGAPPATEADSDPGVRAVAARALSMHGDPAHADLILPLMQESDRVVRLEAARALQRLHNPKAVESLIKASSDAAEAEQDVRAEACVALGQYAENRVLQALIDALDDDSLAVTTQARASLRILTGEDFGENQRTWLDWLKDNRQPFAKRGIYQYPVFERDKFWYEYLPFVPPPPNETTGLPIGLRPDGSSEVTATRVARTGSAGTEAQPEAQRVGSPPVAAGTGASTPPAATPPPTSPAAPTTPAAPGAVTAAAPAAAPQPAAAATPAPAPAAAPVAAAAATPAPAQPIQPTTPPPPAAPQPVAAAPTAPPPPAASPTAPQPTATPQPPQAPPAPPAAPAAPTAAPTTPAPTPPPPSFVPGTPVRPK
ncbi:MAG: HEAT repeat domain-containing protein [Phycisphaerales bacterium]|nr:HEAT repeat domain-containing protein [Phycisphaerales bacterium]